MAGGGPASCLVPPSVVLVEESAPASTLASTLASTPPSLAPSVPPSAAVTQLPPMHVAPCAHVLPQTPQLVLSVVTSRQAPLQLLLPDGQHSPVSQWFPAAQA